LHLRSACHGDVHAARENSKVSIQERALYASENGDRWSLAHAPDTGHVFVRHRPNLSSGGKASDIDVGEFLVRGGLGPEKQELLRLIGLLVEMDSSAGNVQD
jgi:hypothetical protein